MIRRFLETFVLVSAAALALVACGENKATYKTLTVQKAYDQYSQSENAIIVDVRNPEEWAATGIPVGAALIPLPEFTRRAPNELSKDKEIYVICNSGNRSRTASQELIDLGYKKVYNVDGGIQAWLGADLPVAPYTP
jgi:rhodanese-related sulfurtransferase